MPLVLSPRRGWRQRLYTRLWQRGVDHQHAQVLAAGGKPRPAHLVTGERGEDEAYWYLRGLGYDVVARRWRGAPVRGDLDLIAWDGDTLAIVEVKTRTARDLVTAGFAVDHEKQEQLRRLTRRYVNALTRDVRSTMRQRFDIVSVYLLPHGVEMEHVRSAFRADDPRPRSVRDLRGTLNGT